MLQKAIPVLPVQNLTTAIQFYENKLGFKAVNFGIYAILKNNTAVLQLSLVNSAIIPLSHSCFIVVKNIEDYYAHLAAQELIQPLGKLIDKGMGRKEFSIQDNNGNLIRFGQ
jgi:catechol 2,3-dioxygenase-like lactoylglutathione lyase family enzyme